MTGALLAVEDEGDVAFLTGQRTVVAACFARFLDGAVLDGPPWRVDPTETLPTREEWLADVAVFI